MAWVLAQRKPLSPFADFRDSYKSLLSQTKYLLGQEALNRSCGATRLGVSLSYAHSKKVSAYLQKSIQFHISAAIPPSAALCKKGMKLTILL